VPETRVRTLRRAAEIVGGEESLALHLGINPSHLSLWIRRAADTSDAVFLRAVDIVQEHESVVVA
jgi:DNA-binding transcriptional regulator YdaS (Cro superfamily)